VTDVFLSYAREDLSRATILSKALESRGFSVWWDRRIPAGQDFAAYIEQQAGAARCIVVLWSKAACASRFVKDEAAIGLSSNRLVPVLIESGVQQPMGFRQVQAADLADWDGKPEGEAFESLVASIRDVSPLQTETAGVRPETTPTRAPGDAGQARTGQRRRLILAVAIAVVVGAGAWMVWIFFGGTDEPKGRGTNALTDAGSAAPNGTGGVAADSSRLQIPRGEPVKVRVDVGDMAVPYAVSVSGQVRIKSLTSQEVIVGDLRTGDNQITWSFSHVVKGWHHKVSVIVGTRAPVVLDQRSAAAGDSENAVGAAVLVVGK